MGQLLKNDKIKRAALGRRLSTMLFVERFSVNVAKGYFTRTSETMAVDRSGANFSSHTVSIG